MREEFVFSEFTSEQLLVATRMVNMGVPSDKAYEMLYNTLLVASRVLGVDLDDEIEDRYSKED